LKTLAGAKRLELLTYGFEDRLATLYLTVINQFYSYESTYV